MADSAAEQRAPEQRSAEQQAAEQPSSTRQQSGAAPLSSGSAEAEPELLEKQIVERLERVVRAAGAGLRRLRNRIRERRQAQTSGAETPAGESAAHLSEQAFQVPEELRGLVERYPVQAMLASCGAGYLLGALIGGRRR